MRVVVMPLVTFRDVDSQRSKDFDVIDIIQKSFGMDGQSICVLDGKDSPQVQLRQKNEPLVIVGHTNAKARGIAGYDNAKEFVAALNAKTPVSERKKITEVYLIACEAGFDNNQRVNLAQEITEEMHKSGYGEGAILKIHAIRNTNLTTHQNPQGMRVEVNGNGGLSAFTVDKEDEELLEAAAQAKNSPNDAQFKAPIATLRVNKDKQIVVHQPIKEALNQVEFTFVPQSQLHAHAREQLQSATTKQGKADALASSVEVIAESMKRNFGAHPKLALKKSADKFTNSVEKLCEKIRQSPDNPEKPIRNLIKEYNTQKKDIVTEGRSTLYKLLSKVDEKILTEASGPKPRAQKWIERSKDRQRKTIQKPAAKDDNREIQQESMRADLTGDAAQSNYERIVDAYDKERDANKDKRGLFYRKPKASRKEQLATLKEELETAENIDEKIAAISKQIANIGQEKNRLPSNLQNVLEKERNNLMDQQQEQSPNEGTSPSPK